MTNVRAIIVKRLKDFRFGPYDLAKLVKGNVSAPTIYAFVKHGRAINARSLGYVLDALDLHIVPGEILDPKLLKKPPARKR